VKKKATLGADIYKEHPSTPEEAFMASVEGSYYGAKMVFAEEEGRIGIVQPHKFHKVHTFWDIGDRYTSVWFCQFVKNRIHVIDYYQDNDGLGAPEYGRVLQSKQFIYGQHFGPPDLVGGNKRCGPSGRMTKDVFAEAGINFTVINAHTIEDRITVTRDVVLDICWFDKNKCEQGITCLKNYRKEKDEQASTEDLIVYKNNPAHDAFSHGADAFGYMAVAYRSMEIEGEVLGFTGAVKTSEGQESTIYDYDSMSSKF
jgi:hypothetical protein